MNKTGVKTLIIIISFALFLAIAISVNKKMEQDEAKRVLDEARRKVAVAFWDKTEILMPIDKVLQLYPEVIEDVENSSGDHRIFKSEPIHYIKGRPYSIQFYFENGFLKEVSLHINEQDLRSYSLRGYAYDVYDALNLKYGNSNRSYTYDDFMRRNGLFCQWNDRLITIGLVLITDNNFKNFYIFYKINQELISSYAAASQI